MEVTIQITGENARKAASALRRMKKEDLEKLLIQSVQSECPRCHQMYTEYPALSRRDNQTDICPDCGTAEAMEDFARQPYTGPVYWIKEQEQPHDNPTE